VDRAVRVSAVLLSLAGRHTGQDLDPLVDGRDAVDVELAVSGGLDDLVLEHEILQVVYGDEDALALGESLGNAQVEEALDLLGGAADGLHLSVLVDRACNGRLCLIGSPDITDSDSGLSRPYFPSR